jgi:hypothetical protein
MAIRGGAALAMLSLLLLLAAGCGVKSDPSWPGGVWGDAPMKPAPASSN